jgi:hypothetical protein
LVVGTWWIVWLGVVADRMLLRVEKYARMQNYFFERGCPAGRASCAEGGRLHAFLKLRVVLPLVGMIFFATNGSAMRSGIHVTK